MDRQEDTDNGDRYSGYFEVGAGQITLVIFLACTVIAVLCGKLGLGFLGSFEVAGFFGLIIFAILAWPTSPLP